MDTEISNVTDLTQFKNELGKSSEFLDLILPTLNSWLLSKSSQETRRSYARTVARFIQHFGADNLCALKPAMIVEWINQQGLCPTSSSQRISAIKSFYNVLIVNDFIDRNPAQVIKSGGKANSRHYTPVPTNMIVEVLRKLDNSNNPKDLRDASITRFLVNFSLRNFEVSNLVINSITETHLLISGKGQKDITYPFEECETRNSVMKWLEVRNNTSKYVFTNFSRSQEVNSDSKISTNGIREIIKNHFPAFSPHCLRSRGVTDLFNNSGQNIALAAAFARHSDSSVTRECYIDGNQIAESMRFRPRY